MKAPAVLVIRLGAMGDIIHALPAVASLKQSFPEHRLYWAVAAKWMPLLEGNPFVDVIVPVSRHGLFSLKASWQRLRVIRPQRAVDFQGLIQSALVGRIARPGAFFGFANGAVRERPAALLYSHRLMPNSVHVVEKNLELAQSAGAASITHRAFIPEGREEGDLPRGPFVLASPFAGWISKQWPIESYNSLGQRLRREGLQLVANVPAERANELTQFEHVHVHVSALAGLIAATRRAVAVVGVDSGPLHLAAALHKPGVALFGPTDPARNGPYGESMNILRAEGFETTYKRDGEIHPSMRALYVDDVAERLLQSIAALDAVR